MARAWTSRGGQGASSLVVSRGVKVRLVDDLDLDDQALVGRVGEGIATFAADPGQRGGDLCVAVTRGAADHVAAVFTRMTARGIARAAAQRFTLQCVVALSAEALGAAPPGMFARVVAECRLQLGVEEREQLSRAAQADWSRVEPASFGALFQASLDPGRRHALGAHFTSEADIARIVVPTIVRPWRERIRGAGTIEELAQLRRRLGEYRVLDPACGSGDFLHSAYRAVVRLEIELVQRMRELGGAVVAGAVVRVGNFLGLERDPLAVELARVTMLLGEQRARGEQRAAFAVDPSAGGGEAAIRWDHVNTSISEADALFVEWPAADAIVGNPPFQAKNKLQGELGVAYVQALRARYPEVSGMADYCVYWFRRAHDALPPGGRAGLVGTNTIRQNASRESGLAHIVRTGTIVEAVASAVWPCDAAVHVSIVNWVKGCERPGKRRLSWQEGDRADGPWVTLEVDEIGPSLCPGTDLSAARTLAGNAGAGCCYQGQTHGHAGFLLSAEEAEAMISASPRDAEVIFPLVNGEELLAGREGAPRRYVIDFGERELAAGAQLRGAVSAGLAAGLAGPAQRDGGGAGAQRGAAGPRSPGAGESSSRAVPRALVAAVVAPGRDAGGDRRAPAVHRVRARGPAPDLRVCGAGAAAG